MIWRVVKVLGPDLWRILRDDNAALWSKVRLRAVKPRALPRRCAICQYEFKAGDSAFAPIGNQSYRYERLCIPCVGSLKGLR